jgi:hypothetical protein
MCVPTPGRFERMDEMTGVEREKEPQEEISSPSPPDLEPDESEAESVRGGAPPAPGEVQFRFHI